MSRSRLTAHNVVITLMGLSALFGVVVFCAICSRIVLHSAKTVVTGAITEASGGLEMLSRVGGLWLRPSHVTTNSETGVFEFSFQTQEPNVGALVLSRLPGDPTWYFEAYHNARVETCRLDSKLWKDCRVLLVLDPIFLEAVEKTRENRL